MKKGKKEDYIDKADESKGEIYDLCYYYFKDDCKPMNLLEELQTKYGVKTSLETIKHCYKCGWHKRHIIDYLTHTTTGQRKGYKGITINDYFASKGIKVEDI